MKSLAIIVACFAATCFGEQARFDNYRVYQLHIKTDYQLSVLKGMQFGWDGVLFFRTPFRVPEVIEIIVPPHKFADIIDLFKVLKIKYKLLISNVQR